MVTLKNMNFGVEKIKSRLKCPYYYVTLGNSCTPASTPGVPSVNWEWSAVAKPK